MERKIVKLRVDMYSDTKFKIIDTMDDRDLIHYLWARILTLAGKVNLEGDLYLSKSIPYSIETLALEFNRSAKKVQLALKIFMDLEMVELTKDNVYRVRNFAKHQNIKSKKKEHDIDRLETVDNMEGAVDKSSDIDGIVNKEIIENTDNSYGVEDKVDALGNIENEVNIQKIIVNDKSENSKCNLDNKEKSQDKIVLDRKKDIDVTELSESNDKSTLNKNLLKNDVSKKDKVDLDKEFVFSKDENKKKRNKPNKPKKKDEACDIISIWDDEDDVVEICGFSDKPPAGKLITTFKV
ncbi:phage replisome organizer N-terminal domain-containing protein [uncultured Clostridium sp.]|uniref:phage replisome organizer N-terminal domain-containing protein n=1 Tax=uncultured Clostridium sp. TaxID=59620 RepID=UPI0028E74303|nr:phage replisome organizer N-terminal domain-containing protein [uncultured Clostridium sp.]